MTQNQKGLLTDIFVRLRVGSYKRLQCLDFFPIYTVPQLLRYSDPDILKGPSLFFSLSSHFLHTTTITTVVITPSIYYFVFFGESWPTNPHNKSSRRLSWGRCRGQTMQSLMFFTREVQGHRARWRRASAWDVITSAEMPPATWHCSAILVRWEISRDEIRCILLIPEGKLGHFNSKLWTLSLRIKK